MVQSAGKSRLIVVPLLKKHRIDHIVVIASDRRVVGLIDVQDLSRQGLL
jgi:CBS domain-containing protein